MERTCVSVLDCGDGVREVTALAMAALKTLEFVADTATPTQSGDSEDSVAAVQNLADIRPVHGKSCGAISGENFSLFTKPNQELNRYVMKVILALALMLGACALGRADEPKMTPVMEQDGITYVAGTALARDAAIAIKKLPGSDFVVACSSDRCAQLKDFLKKGDEFWVSTAALAKALGLSARFTDDQRQVRFDVVAQESSASDEIARVGQLAPNFRLPKLDGSTVSLADFRGKRVLIESWASW